MKKYLLFSILFFVLIAGTAFAKPADADPFKALWDAVAHLQQQIDNIELLAGPQGEPGPVGPQGEQGPQGDKGDSGAGTLHLYDKNGQDLGLIINSSQLITPETYLPSLNAFITFKQILTFSGVQVEIPQSQGGSDAAIYFENNDCTGKAYYPIAQPGVPYKILKTKNNTFFKITDRFSSDVLVNSNLTDRCIVGGIGGPFQEVEEVSLPFSYPPAGPLEIRNQ